MGGELPGSPGSRDIEPGAEEALFNGSVEWDRYSGALPASGDYTAGMPLWQDRLFIYLMRNAARRDETCRFEITFSIAD